MFKINNKCILLGLIISIIILIKSASLYAQDVNSWPEFFNSNLSGKMFLPDKTQLNLNIKLLDNSLVVTINQIEYVAKDIKLFKDRELNFCIYPTSNISQKLLFEGNIIDKVVMGGIVIDVNSDKGHWWVKVPDETIEKLY